MYKGLYLFQVVIANHKGFSFDQALTQHRQGYQRRVGCPQKVRDLRDNSRMALGMQKALQGLRDHDTLRREHGVTRHDPDHDC